MEAPTIELLAGPANPAKSRRLLELCAERVREGREGSFLFIVPSPQRVEQVNEWLLCVAPQGFFKPHVDTFNGLIAMLYDLLGARAAPISDAVKAVLVQEILTTHADRFPFLTRGDGCEPFPGLVVKLCGLIADLKRSLVEPDHLAAQGQKLPGRPRRRAEELAEFYRLYQDRLQQHELMDGEGVFWLLIESLKRKEVRDRLSRFDLLMLDGIHDLTVAEWRVLEGLVQAIDHTIVAIDYWPEAGPAGRAAEHLYRDLLAAGAQQADVPPPEASSRRDAAASGLFAMPSALREPWACRGRLRVLRCNDRQHEVKVAGEQIKALVRGGAEARGIVVATADLSHYTRLIRELFTRYGIPVDVSAGLPLAQAPAAAAAMQVVRTVLAGYQRRDVVNCLRSPYLRFVATGETAPLEAGAADWISREAGILRGRDEWAKMLKLYEARLADAPAGAPGRERSLRRVKSARPAIEEFLDLLAKLEGSHKPQDFRQRLRQVLGRLGFQQQIIAGRGLGLSAPDVRRDTVAFDRFWRCVDSVVFCTRFAEPRSYGLAELHEMLAAALEEMPFRPERRGQGVKVVSVRDVRALDVDHLFVLGMVEGEFPRVRVRDIFFSEPDQARLGMKVEPRVDDEDRHLFYQCLARPTACVALLWPATVEGRDTLRSPFIEEALRITDVEEEAPQAPTRPQAVPDLQAYLGRALSTPVSELAADARDEIAGWLAREPQLAGRVWRNLRVRDARRDLSRLSRYQGFVGPVAAGHWPADKPRSISQFEAYGRCPFAFFMERVLGLVEPEEPSEDLSALTRGDLLHTVLRRYYIERREDGKTALEPDDDAAAERKRIKRIAEELFEDLDREGLFWDAEYALIMGADGRPGLLDRFIECEMEDETACQPAFFEAAFGDVPWADYVDATIPLPALTLPRNGAPEATLVGKIDRIDLAEGGRFLVIDYKTSSSIPGKQETMDGVHLQTPAYLLAVRQGKPDWRPVGGVYYQIRSLSDFGKTRPLVSKSMEDAYRGARAAKPQLLKDEEFDALLDKCEEWIVKYARWIRNGKFPPMRHRRNSGCAAWCPYRHACRIDPARMTHDAVVALLEEHT